MKIDFGDKVICKREIWTRGFFNEAYADIYIGVNEVLRVSDIVYIKRWFRKKIPFLVFLCTDDGKQVNFYIDELNWHFEVVK